MFYLNYYLCKIHFLQFKYIFYFTWSSILSSSLFKLNCILFSSFCISAARKLLFEPKPDLNGDVLKILFLALSVCLGLQSKSNEPWDPELVRFLANDNRLPIKIDTMYFMKS